MQHHYIVVLTGAGISAESGLGTFRDVDGIWSQHRLEDVATPEGFERNPTLVHEFYNARRKQAAHANPNAAHIALARLQADYPGTVVIVTQNVDDLHEKAGASAIHMHGELKFALCHECGHRWESPATMHPGERCPNCEQPAGRPDVVWFGEIPYHMDAIMQHLRASTLFAAIGTSGEVYPAANFVDDVRKVGAHTVEINLAATDGLSRFAEQRLGAASQIVPVWVNDLLAES
ncbi:MAG: NAD-dependent deacylase [Aestuariivita sp.]|nr:NAD-dependent deacylase [Aestuariivita sp.]MCY4203617.1 NAD-dependent deacylase [Aestuariivita sp.]MCY4288953.1 NAD-dependent deacylase [Aestuariivita sp.]MCY4346194.1 NAD-dependent deacylase [Aestuariivita sp.]